MLYTPPFLSLLASPPLKPALLMSPSTAHHVPLYLVPMALVHLCASVSEQVP